MMNIFEKNSFEFVLLCKGERHLIYYKGSSMNGVTALGGRGVKGFVTIVLKP
jgi:hypothetical protein